MYMAFLRHLNQCKEFFSNIPKYLLFWFLSYIKVKNSPILPLEASRLLYVYIYIYIYSQFSRFINKTQCVLPQVSCQPLMRLQSSGTVYSEVTLYNGQASYNLHIYGFYYLGNAIWFQGHSSSVASRLGRSVVTYVMVREGSPPCGGVGR